MRMRALLWTAAAWVAAAASADAQEGKPAQEERLKKLEDQVKKQQEEIDKLKKTGDVKVSIADGLRYKSADGTSQFRVGGRLMEALRIVLARPDASRTSPDTFFLRSARLQ